MLPIVRRTTSLALTALLAAVTVSSALAAQAVPATPAALLPVQWGIDADSLMVRADSAGWTFLRIDDDGDYAFAAEIDGQEAVVFATFGDHGLCRLEAGFAPHLAAPITYHQLIDSLSTRYGPAIIEEGEDSGVRHPANVRAAAAWTGILLGLRRDGWITLVFTSPEISPTLPARRGKLRLFIA